MPPEGEPKPDVAKLAAAEAEIARALDAVVVRRRAEGRATLRRLNRVEYENTVRDLFEVNVASRRCCPKTRFAGLRQHRRRPQRLARADGALPRSGRRRARGRRRHASARCSKERTLLDSGFAPELVPSRRLCSRRRRASSFAPTPPLHNSIGFRPTTPGVYRFKVSAYATNRKCRCR